LKLRQLFLAVLCVCIAAVSVRADEVPDGLIKMGRGSDPSPTSDSCQEHFTINLNSNGGGIKNCINTSNDVWIGLEITAAIPSNSTVTCVTLIFANCTFTTSMIGNGNSGKKQVDIILYGGAVITTGSKQQTDCTVIPSPLSCFFLNFNDGSNDNPLAPGGWFGFDGKRGGTVKVDAITAPEPATVFLIVAGLGILGPLRRVRYA